MLRSLFILIGVVCIGFSALGQRRGGDTWKKYRHEVGVGYGYNSIYAGLGEDDAFGLNKALLRSTFNGNYRFFVLRFLSVKASVTHGYARKNDKSENRTDRPSNLRIDYKSNFSEFAGIVEFHLFDETGVQRLSRIRRARGGLQKQLRFGLSAYAGFAFDIIRSSGEYYGDRVEFRPVNTNPGQAANTERYDQTFFHVPLGVNIRYVIDPHWRLGVDIGYRLGFRDYIDNVSAVHYVNEENQNTSHQVADKSFVGLVTFEEGDAPLNELSRESGRSGYWVGLISLSYRLKL